MIRFLTAGESHGKGLTAILEGIPSNLAISKNYIDKELKRRQQGYGRGLRMKIESDSVEILSGVRFEKTLGSPISLFIKNNDWENWKEIVTDESLKNYPEKITIPRPGHADLTASQKYNYDDIRNSIERASARETAARVAVGSIARKFLEEFGISIGSFVESIGNIYPDNNYADELLEHKIKSNLRAYSISTKADKSSVRVLDERQEEKIIRKIKTAKKKGDTLGGTFYVIATGVPAGIGSHVQYDKKLNAQLSLSISSINAIKSVEIGKGIESANIYGSECNDEIVLRQGKLSRNKNYSGGIEGGISTGLPIIIRAAMKPIATLMTPIKTVDLSKMKGVKARRERSDFVAVPACAVVAESMAAISLAEAMMQKFGGDSIEETKDNYDTYTKKINKRITKNFGRKR